MVPLNSSAVRALEIEAAPETQCDRAREYKKAVRHQLELIGEEPLRPGLQKTPERVAQAMLWLTRGYERDDPVVFRRLVQNLRFAGAADSRGDPELFDEALALRMHESDPVVRRRLVSRMRLDLEAEAPAGDPDAAHQ